MKLTLPEYVAQNEDLRQTLLTQKGGIAKYLAEHLYANSTAALFSDYQNHCVDVFFEANKWDLDKVWTEDVTRRVALGEFEHLKKELKYQTALMSDLAGQHEKIKEMISRFTDQYLTYAYEQHRHHYHPEGMTDLEIYSEVIEKYNSTGLAYKCMEIILKEHHAKSKLEKTETDLWTEYVIRQWSEHLTIRWFKKMRKAVAEMLVGKTDAQCRQMAIDTLDKVRDFSQIIYSDTIVEALRKANYTMEADKRERDGEWLRNVALTAFFERINDKGKNHSMRYYFAHFVTLLKDIGRIWAAQLLVRGIDIRDLEEKHYCILDLDTSPNRYVDKNFIEDLPNQYCIANYELAKSILKKMGRKPQKECHLEVINKEIEGEVNNKLSKAYNILVTNKFLNDESTSQISFIDVFINNSDKKIVWLNDPKTKFLKTLIRVFLGRVNKYPYRPILKFSGKGSYTDFIQKHFVDKNFKSIELSTRDHDVGKAETRQFEAILKAIYGEIKHAKTENSE